MGIYYFAVDYDEKKQMWPPDDFCIKSPGIFHPHNPFPNMVTMKNCQGYDFKIIMDTCTEIEHEFEDISKEVYEELQEIWSAYDWDEAEWTNEK